MPHKHTAQSRSDKDFNLAPSQRARPLPVKGAGDKAKSKKRKRNDGDDTPAAFKRLMAMQDHMKSRTSGSNKEQVQDKASKPGTKEGGVEQSASAPFSEPKKARGNTDPANHLPRDTGSIPVMNSRSTKLQRKIEKKVSRWRTEDERLRAKAVADKAAIREAEEERIAAALERSGVSAGMMDDDEFLKEVGLGWDDEREGDKGTDTKERGKKKRAKKEEDDWAVLKEQRGARPKLSDVAQAPPTLKKVREVFKTKGKDSGGLKGKADLGEARAEVLRRYREMMGR